MNQLWRTAFGDYEFALDRRALTYSLTETKTGTTWAETLRVGWAELEEIETGTRTRFDFGQAKVVSVSEKSGPQGKRILLGMDLHGVPFDLYFICSSREIQLTVEASRDTRMYRLQDVGLFPGLVAVPDDNASYLVLPQGEGAMLFAHNIPPTPHSLGIWAADGVNMPFIGAVRCAEDDVRHCRSAIGLITDSAYGRFMLLRQEDGTAALDTEYDRDPERRRLDVRIVVIPNSNHSGIARAYRDKIVGERNHLTLRKKMRERSQLESILCSAAILQEQNQTDADDALLQLKEVRDNVGITAGLIDNYYLQWHGDIQTDVLNIIHAIPYKAVPLVYFLEESEVEIKLSYYSKDVDGVCLREIANSLTWAFPEDYDKEDPLTSRNRWEEMDWRMQCIDTAKKYLPHVGVFGFADWAAISIDFAYIWTTQPLNNGPSLSALPLLPICYHDSVMSFLMIDNRSPHEFLRAILSLCLPLYSLPKFNEWTQEDRSFMKRTFAILGPLSQLTFPAFLTEHRFLTADRQVEEAIYSDKTRIVINQSEANDWESGDLHLPPLGFYVRHAQMEAHDALRLGDQTFSTRAWRVRRARDGQPLDASHDVLTQEFTTWEPPTSSSA